MAYLNFISPINLLSLLYRYYLNWWAIQWPTIPIESNSWFLPHSYHSPIAGISTTYGLALFSLDCPHGHSSRPDLHYFWTTVKSQNHDSYLWSFLLFSFSRTVIPLPAPPRPPPPVHTYSMPYIARHPRLSLI